MGCPKKGQKTKKLENVWKKVVQPARNTQKLVEIHNTRTLGISVLIFDMFQAYLVTLFMALLPGLLERGLMQKFLAQLTLKIAEMYKGQNQIHKKAE